MPSLSYSEHVVKESMCLYLPGLVMGREAIGECEVVGYRMPAATALMSQ
jgi:cytochrome P450